LENVAGVWDVRRGVELAIVVLDVIVLSTRYPLMSKENYRRLMNYFDLENYRALVIILVFSHKTIIIYIPMKVTSIF
jgi:hypothetical protein